MSKIALLEIAVIISLTSANALAAANSCVDEESMKHQLEAFQLQDEKDTIDLHNVRALIDGLNSQGAVVVNDNGDLTIRPSVTDKLRAAGLLSILGSSKDVVCD